MKTILTTTIALLMGLTLSQPALARGGGGGGGSHGGGGGGFHGGGGGGFHGGGGGGHAMISHGGGGRSMGGGFGGRSFAAGRSFSGGQGRVVSPSVRSAQTAGFARSRTAGFQRSQTAGLQRNQFAGTAARTNRVRGNNSIAFGGHNFAGANTGRVPGDVSRGWDHGHSHNWGNHRWGWRGNDWVILDGGYYDGYGYDSYDYPYGYGYVDPGYAQPQYSDAAPAAGDNLAADVQQALDQNGYDAGPADGDVGPQTRNAIAAFQQDHGLNPTGRINTPLLRALRID